MRKTTCLLLLGCCIVSLSCGGLYAAFRDTAWGARPLGMGGAFSAVADDANAPLFNPAGIAQVARGEISFASARLFAGLEGIDLGLNYLSYLHPLSRDAGNLGVTWASLSSAGLYREDAGSITYGRFLGGENIAFGVNAKLLRIEYDLDVRTVDDPVFSQGTVKNALSVDVGFLASLQESGLSFAIALKNINSPDMGLRTEDALPSENVFGVAYYRERMPFLGLPYSTFALDFVNRDKKTETRLGLETWLFDGSFAVRAGGRPQEMTFGLGYELGIAAETKLIVDYAFAWPLQMEQTNGSHRLGLTVRFP